MNKAQAFLKSMNEGKVDVIQKAMADIRIAIKGLQLGKGNESKIAKLLSEIKQIALVGH